MMGSRVKTGLDSFVVGSVLVLLVVACNGGGGSTSTPVTQAPATASAVATGTRNSTPTPSPSLEEQINTAYSRYWEAYGQALLNLDAGLVATVAAGDELQRIKQEIETLRSQGVALRVVIKHNPLIAEASANSATILDEMVNNSFYVNPKTKDPPQASGSGERLRDTFYLQKVGDQWQVVRSTRQR